MDINISKLEEILRDNNSMFLSGNGFSINFDDDFRLVYDNLYYAHKNTVRNTIYEIVSNNKFEKKYYQNYKSVIDYVRFYKKKDIEKIFENALIFNSSIVNNENLMKIFKEEELLSELTFGINELDILKEIEDISSKFGFKYVNIEYWTILIYFYYIIKELKLKDIYEFPKNNDFLTLLRLGDASHILLIEDDNKSIKSNAMYESVSNGFAIYYRLLFINAIFNDGKSIDLDKLTKLDELNLLNINKFLSKFNSLITLNYDNILESLTNREILHLNGKFNTGTKSYVYNQSIEIKHDNLKVDASDIVIGDYFIYKTCMPIVNKLAASKDKNILNINKDLEYTSSLISKESKLTNSNVILLFGVNVLNDYHILRVIMIELYFLNKNKIIEKPKIIYSYYSEEDKQIFEINYNKVITFSEELNNFVKNDIEVYFVSTKEIIKKHFKHKN